MHRNLIEATHVKLLKSNSTQTHKGQEKHPCSQGLKGGKTSHHGTDVKVKTKREIKRTERKPRSTSCGWRVQLITHKINFA